MRQKPVHRARLPTFAVLTLLLASGCATAPETLYGWGDYEARVYARFQNDADAADIDAMEGELEQIAAADKTPAPGFVAHLGLLYLEAGNDDKAIECFQTEKERFPESAVFMDFLLKKYRTESP